MPRTMDVVNGRVAAYQDNSPHGDDAYVTRELNPCSVLDAVLDGATGHGGKYASGYVAEALRECVIDTVEDLVAILGVMNQTLFQRAKGSFLLTTVSVTLKLDNELHVISVGDSPVFLIRNNQIVALATKAKGSLAYGLTNVLGRHEKFSYVAYQTTLQAGDRLVLATDGVTDNVAPTELAALVREAPSPQAAVAALHNLMREKQRRNRGRADDRSSFIRDDATAIFRYIDPSDAGHHLSAQRMVSTADVTRR